SLSSRLCGSGALIVRYKFRLPFQLSIKAAIKSQEPGAKVFPIGGAFCSGSRATKLHQPAGSMTFMNVIAAAAASDIRECNRASGLGGSGALAAFQAPHVNSCFLASICCIFTSVTKVHWPVRLLGAAGRFIFRVRGCSRPGAAAAAGGAQRGYAAGL